MYVIVAQRGNDEPQLVREVGPDGVFDTITSIAKEIARLSGGRRITCWAESGVVDPDGTITRLWVEWRERRA